MTMGAGLPPGAELVNGRVVRRLEVEVNGRKRTITRPVAFTLKDARDNNADFYDEILGWIRAGRKTELENPLPPPQAALIRQPSAFGGKSEE